jgi:hypothetical protein
MPTNSRKAWQLYFPLCEHSEDRKDARKRAVFKLKAEHIPAYRLITWKVKSGSLSPKSLEDIPFPVGTHWHPDIAEVSSGPSIPIPIPNYVL